jgi:NADH-quinone oxidoreductase subunit H
MSRTRFTGFLILSVSVFRLSHFWPNWKKGRLISRAETEIVAGSFTEYSGRHLAFLRLTLNVEMVVGSALLAAVFLPFGYEFGAAIGFFIFLCKIIFIIALLSLSRTIFARLRIDQMISFCWKYLVPFAFLQLLFNLILKGAILR